MVFDKCVTLNRVSHKHISGGGAPGVGDRRRGGGEGSNQRLVGGGSSLYQLMSAYRHLQEPCTLMRLYPSPLLKKWGISPVEPKHKHILSDDRGVL